MIVDNFKPTDYLVINDASKSDYQYYSDYFKFNPAKKTLLTIHKYEKNDYFKLLDSLSKNQSYWFYFPFDYQKKPVIGFLKEWAKKQNKKTREFNYKRTYVLHIKV